MPPIPKTRPAVVLEQQASGYILKWLTEEEFWNKGRHAFYKALLKANEMNKQKGKEFDKSEE